MCEASAYLITDGEPELIMESVDVAIPTEEGELKLVNIFGEQRFIKGAIESLSLVDHKIFIRETGVAS
ncbi:RNA-binding protein [Desulfoluna limicola]|uniref:RNA-binding protein n=1 Tax=Desulfoluna limicola TaxID=2810562 RepID=A0ABN6F8Y0_9BACT|nr:CooT family nickel-binding protein [Desulfoluna limicola]BCS98245.1 RNA-binding protein [Desulfoluna limicola]